MWTKIYVRPPHLKKPIRKIALNAAEFGFTVFYRNLDRNFRKILKYQFINQQEKQVFGYNLKTIRSTELHHTFIAFFYFNIFAILVFLLEIAHFKFVKMGRHRNLRKNSI